jgi:hypothetical protein
VTHLSAVKAPAPNPRRASAKGLFERLLKDEPHEDQLTEALAVVCEHSEAFRSRLLARLLGDERLVDDVEVATQDRYALGLAGPKRLDFVLWRRIKDSDRCEFKLFVEVKYWSHEHVSLGPTGQEPAPQTENYQAILWEHREAFGKLGLFALTPRLNPLPLTIRSEYAAAFLRTDNLNIFWEDIGRLAAEAAENASDPVTRLLCADFAQYLRRIGLMTEQEFTIQEIAVAAQYIPVKRKLWSVLEPVAQFLAVAIDSGDAEPSFATASKVEREEDAFYIWRSLNKSTGLNVGAGFQFYDGFPYVGVWMVVEKSQTQARDDIRQAVKRALRPDSYGGDRKEWTEDFAEDKWYTARDDNEWGWVCGCARPLTHFVTDPRAIPSMSQYLIARLKELLRIKGLDRFFKMTVKADATAP